VTFEITHLSQNRAEFAFANPLVQPFSLFWEWKNEIPFLKETKFRSHSLIKQSNTYHALLWHWPILLKEKKFQCTAKILKKK
jgi:hypothetical protein